MYSCIPRHGSIKLLGVFAPMILGGVMAAKAFKAAGIYGGLRAKGEKPDLDLAVCDAGATSAGAFATNVVAAVRVRGTAYWTA